RGELDVAHALAPHLAAGHLDAAPLTDDALEADALVLAAVALPVLGGTEDLLAEQPVLLRLQRPVVDGLGLLDLAVGPRADLLRRGEADAELVEVVDVKHASCLPGPGPLSRGKTGHRARHVQSRPLSGALGPRLAPSSLTSEHRLPASLVLLVGAALGPGEVDA